MKNNPFEFLFKIIISIKLFTRIKSIKHFLVKHQGYFNLLLVGILVYILYFNKAKIHEHISEHKSYAPNITANVDILNKWRQNDQNIDDKCGLNNIPRFHGIIQYKPYAHSKNSTIFDIHSGKDKAKFSSNDIVYTFSFYNSCHQKGMTREEFTKYNRSFFITDKHDECIKVIESMIYHKGDFMLYERDVHLKSCPELYDLIWNQYETLKKAQYIQFYLEESDTYSTKKVYNPIYTWKMYTGGNEMKKISCGTSELKRQLHNNFKTNDFVAY